MTHDLTHSLPARARRIGKACAVGALGGIGRWYHSAGVPILCYHSVDDSGSLLSISKALFREQMEFLNRNGYETMALSQLRDALTQGRKLPTKAVVLTFDDGYRNSYSEVLPTLKTFGFTATVFVVTRYVGAHIGWVKTDDVPEIPLASWDELAEMSDEGLDIQSHTASHENLKGLSLSDVRSEILESKDEIERRLRKPVTLFAYPYGELTPAITEIVRELGFTGAVTMEVGRTSSSDPPLRLKRMNVTEVSRVSDRTRMSFFKSCVSGTAVWYCALKELFPALVNRNRPWESTDRT